MRKEEAGRRVRRRYAANRGHDPPRGGKSRRAPGTGAPPLPREAEGIRTWLEQVRFKKAAFGGVDEADVWKKIGELNTLYEQALAAERMRYDALLAERGKAAGGGLPPREWADWPKEAGDVPYE